MLRRHLALLALVVACNEPQTGPSVGSTNASLATQFGQPGDEPTIQIQEFLLSNLDL